MDDYQHPCVVVGVSGSLTGLAALRAAVGEARRRRVPLYAVRAVADCLAGVDAAEVTTAFREALGCLPTDVEIRAVVTMLGVKDALRAAATDPRDLIVVGGSGKGGWHALCSGSVARGLIPGTRCPIMVVPAPEMAREERRSRRSGLGRGDLWERIEQEVPELRGDVKYRG